MAKMSEGDIIATMIALQKKGVTIAGRLVMVPLGLGIKSLGRVDALKQAGFNVIFKPESAKSSPKKQGGAH